MQPEGDAYALDLNMPHAPRPLRTLVETYLTAFRAVRHGPEPAHSEPDAPCLTNWTAAIRGREIVLVGSVTRHPILGDTRVQTSTLIYVSQDRQWARTLSRWYRLGAAFVPTLPAEHTGDLLPGFFVPIDEGIISLPLHMALKFTARRPQEVADVAFRAGLDDLVPELIRLARAWTSMPKEISFQDSQAI